jgi:hypothetical protein
LLVVLLAACECGISGCGEKSHGSQKHFWELHMLLLDYFGLPPSPGREDVRKDYTRGGCNRVPVNPNIATPVTGLRVRNICSCIGKP